MNANLKSMKGQRGIIAVVIGIILLVAVAIPVTTDVIGSANLTGTASTIIDLLPVFLALAGLVLVAGLSGGFSR